MKIVALATCHNRRDLTLRALSTLWGQRLPPNCNLEVCIVDDNSTDGTREAVSEQFPETTIIAGSGELYWAGGMRFGWKEFVEGRDPDYLLVFNDDIRLYPGAISGLLAAGSELESEGCHAYAVAGAMKDPETGEPAYGGVVRDRKLYPLSFAAVQPGYSSVDCHTLNMNLALISRGALQRIGFLSSDFAHRKADYDFGLRLRKAGGRVVVAGHYLGECHRNPATGTSEERDISLRERWRRLVGVKEHPPRERLSYCRRHGGALWLGMWTVPYVYTVAIHALGFLQRRVPRRKTRANH